MTARQRLTRTMEAVVSNTPKGVIRGLALAAALIGLAIVAAIATRNILWERPIALGPMLWGVALLAWGCLVIQRGDPSTALKDWIDGATRIRGFFGFTPPAAPVAVTCRSCGKIMAFCLCEDDEPPVNDR